VSDFTNDEQHSYRNLILLRGIFDLINLHVDAGTFELLPGVKGR